MFQGQELKRILRFMIQKAFLSALVPRECDAKSVKRGILPGEESEVRRKPRTVLSYS